MSRLLQQRVCLCVWIAFPTWIKHLISLVEETSVKTGSTFRPSERVALRVQGFVERKLAGALAENERSDCEDQGLLKPIKMGCFTFGLVAGYRDWDDADVETRIDFLRSPTGAEEAAECLQKIFFIIPCVPATLRILNIRWLCLIWYSLTTHGMFPNQKPEITVEKFPTRRVTTDVCWCIELRIQTVLDYRNIAAINNFKNNEQWTEGFGRTPTAGACSPNSFDLCRL